MPSALPPSITERLPPELLRELAEALEEVDAAHERELARALRERREAEAALQVANDELRLADQRKNDFLAELSHELRNPLAPILSSVHVLERADGCPGPVQHACQVIARQAQHMLRLIEDLLDVARISRGRLVLQREQLDLNALVCSTAEDHRAEFDAKGVHLVIEDAGEPLWVSADRTRLIQVIVNVLGNAAKFTPRGGMTLVAIGADAGSEAVVSIRDTGVGMAPATLSRVFEPFVQAAKTLDRSNRGLGLGLAVVRGMVLAHGGTVRAESDGEGRGTEVMVRLPLAGPARAESLPPASHVRDATPRRVLVVEDNPDVAESLKDALEIGHHEVAVAMTGPEGVEVARHYKPDVVLCDIGLPGMDGYQVARTLRADPDEELRSTFLVALSGYTQQADVQRALDAGFDRHVAKPPSMDTLEQVIEATPPKRPSAPPARAHS